MKDSTAMAFVVAGLVLAMLGVGGVEASMDNVQLAQGFFVALVGVMTMGVGALAIGVNTNSNFYN